MRSLPILFLMVLFSSCTPQAFHDFMVGEEKVLEELIFDESGYPIGSYQTTPTRIPLRQF